ncbi:hypothetical protein HDU76_008510 [Blyttiomyces sp. JEL0837]|nr:hypothetical protein HDU76_008510 [Blyttiomyces sp. JEL0837]
MIARLEDVPSHLDLVGLRRGENGRTCPLHPDACGLSVAVGAIVRLKTVTVEVSKGKFEWAVACVLFHDGGEGCRVGFLARFLVPYRDHLNNRFGRVVELYKGHTNTAHRAFDYQNHGAGLMVLLDESFSNDVPAFE